MATLTFYGAAQEVTGSCYLLESPALGRVLLDCGMHQGGDAVDRVQNDEFIFDPGNIDAVILSHAHLDHSGLLPKLVHEGFSGPIYLTSPSADLLEIMLQDSVGLYERDLERENLRRERSGRKLLKPAYTKRDVKKVLKQCHGQPYGHSTTIGHQASVCFYDAGHILGSSIVEIKITEKNQSKTLVFSGDLGKNDSVLMNDPVKLHKADLVLMESTYGNRDHRSMDNTLTELKTILKTTWENGGNVMIPSFAVGRTQELLFHLGCLYEQGELDNWQIFLDSPMAIAVTKVYGRWLHILDSDDVRHLSAHHRQSLEKFLPSLRLCVTPEESMAINRIKQGAIIIAGSGMCTGGRIRHHFKQRIWNKNNSLIFVGFQARGTLGRILIDGQKHIKLFGEDYIVRANIATLGGFSAHAGQAQLVDWASQFEGNPRLMLIHGEAEALDALSQRLWEEKGISTEIPRRGQCIAF